MSTPFSRRPRVARIRLAAPQRPTGRILVAAALLLGLVGWALTDVSSATPATRSSSPAPVARPDTAATAWTWTLPRNLDLTATALAGRQARRVQDHAFRTMTSPGQRVEADTTATASSTCTSCAAHATTLHVLYLDSVPRVAVDNVATAWSRCHRCKATSLSVQVVLVPKHVRLTARNRALSLNASCARCHTASAAFQIVVAARAPLSPTAMKQLRQWFGAQAASLRNGGPPAPLRTGTAAAESLHRLVHIVQSGGVVVRRAVRLDVR